MAEEDPKGFVIRDKRGGTEERPAETPKPAPASERARESAPRRQSAHDAAPPITFASFVFSLGTSALMLLGEKLDPNADVPVNLPQAKEIIDILSMLEAKTKGNLNDEEKAVLENTLYALRMKWVDLASGKPGSSS
jgi:Domain of unknown function (DUF1844)